MTELAMRPSETANRRDIFLRISKHLACEVEIQSALAAVAGEIGEVLPFTHVDICLLDGLDWVVSYEVGIKTRWSRRRTRLSASPIRDLLRGKTEYMLCENAMEDPRQTFPGATSEPIFNHRLRSRMHVGMRVMGQLIGTLNISHSETGLFDEDSLRLAQHLADLLAPYFHALRSIEKAQRDASVRAEVQSREEGLRQGALRLTQALEQERQRIGMDLHDQTLADLTRLLRLVTSEGANLSPEILADSLSTCVRDLRRIIDEAVPSQLQLFGFCHAISEHLEKAARQSDTIVTTVEDRTDGAIDNIGDTARTALFRIAQEATNNALRHAGASRITVIIDHDIAGALCLSVQDNGCGLSRNGPSRRSGLVHMETRARLISARLDISESDGTRVTVTLPRGKEVSQS
ncbi:ATP-binding protein [Primorskyibacter sp. 2E233]|uniref:GAF domain-containing sensor histidine kinase n=1 Tax=Primorskyibacter sp. 2E233 TaxID=3413431 RepID=UPI003BF20449